MTPSAWGAFILAPLLLWGSSPTARPAEAGAAEAGPAQITVNAGTTVRVPERWRRSDTQLANAVEIVAGPDYPLARILITTEVRTSHRDALQRLADIAVSRDTLPRFVEIGGWPAVELDFTEPLPRRGDAGASSAASIARAIVAIAHDSKLTHFDIWLAPEAPPAWRDEAHGIARSATFPRRGELDAVREELQELERQTQRLRSQSPVHRRGAAVAAAAPRPAATSNAKSVRVILGPQADQLERRVADVLCNADWELRPASDRVGCRRVGPRLVHTGPAEIVSDGPGPGLHSGPARRPADHQPGGGPTTGGYPKLATVASDDLSAPGVTGSRTGSREVRAALA